MPSAHTWPVPHDRPAHAAATQAPWEQTSPGGHAVLPQLVERHCPVESQSWSVAQVTPTQAAGVHCESKQTVPAGQTWAPHVTS